MTPAEQLAATGLIAERLMGWKYGTDFRYFDGEVCIPGSGLLSDVMVSWNPRRNPADALMVLEKLRQNGCRITGDPESFEIEMFDEDDCLEHKVQAETFERAIFLAALAVAKEKQ